MLSQDLGVFSSRSVWFNGGAGRDFDEGEGERRYIN